MSSRTPSPHFFKIIPRKSSYTMPGICVNCGAPTTHINAIRVKQINDDNKIKTSLELFFPLCADCGLAVEKYHTSDRISTIVAVGVAFLPAAFYLVLQILAHASFVTTVLPPLIIFGFLYYPLTFLIKPLGRLLINSQYRRKFTEIRKSVQISSSDQFTVNFDFMCQDFAERFDALNRGT